MRTEFWFCKIKKFQRSVTQQGDYTSHHCAIHLKMVKMVNKQKQQHKLFKDWKSTSRNGIWAFWGSLGQPGLSFALRAWGSRSRDACLKGKHSKKEQGGQLLVADGRVTEEYADKDLEVIGHKRKMTFSITNGESDPEKSSNARNTWKLKRQNV